MQIYTKYLNYAQTYQKLLKNNVFILYAVKQNAG